jgi:hypothetical protein
MQVRLGAFVEQGVLDRLVAKKMPKITSHLSLLGWELADVTKGWFATAFTSHLPPEAAVRVWDVCMSEGAKPLHRVALAIIKVRCLSRLRLETLLLLLLPSYTLLPLTAQRHEPVILGCTQLDVMRKVLDLRLKRTSDERALMDLSFSGIGSMPSALLSAFRSQVSMSI